MVPLTRIAVEFCYWSYGKLSKTAMIRRPEVRVEDLEKIAKKFGVTVNAKKTPATFWTLTRIGWPRPYRYNKVTVQVIGDDVVDIRAYLREVFRLYGEPDEVPVAPIGSKRIGREIIRSVLHESSNKAI